MKTNRRSFLKHTAATSLFATAALHFPFIARAQSSNSKLNLVSIGVGGRAAENLNGVAGEHIHALADVDRNNLDAALKKYAGAKPYRDFRVMLEKEADRIDGVVVSSADHTHAAAAAMALRMGKPVYCEKPLTHTVHEARVLRELAAKHRCVTQMGTQIHAGDNYRRVVELVQTGAIGEVREVHVWVNTGYQFSGGRFNGNTPVPAHLDWDLWLGPVFERPYSAGVHPFDWRRFWDFGNGQLGDFGCHYMDLVHWALDLHHPVTVEAKGPPPDAISTPEWLEVKYQHPARKGQPPVALTWHGGRKPAQLADLRDAAGKPLDWGSGQLFIGSQGMIVSDYGRHLLLPVDQFKDFKRPEPFIPKSIGHHAEWIHAIKNGGPTTCDFAYSGPLTESVLLGNLAYLTGERLTFDGKTGKLKNAPRASAMLHKEYRKGWTL
jgi:predicted dehydrogenase